MNSLIASNINGLVSGKDSLNQKIANGSRASLLLANIDFPIMETKKPSSGSSVTGQYLSRLTENGPLFNGQTKSTNFGDHNRQKNSIDLNKSKNCIDHNQNTFNNSYVTVNGNKEHTAEDGIPVPKIQLYTGKVLVDWKHVTKIGAGLINLGNSCFMNTVLQCLTYCPPLVNYLVYDNDHKDKCKVTGFCMMCILQRHINRSIGKTGEKIRPDDVYNRLRLIAKHFQPGRQEDAHEYLRYVVDHLWKSCLSQNNNSAKLDPASKETTVVNQIFGGYHRSQVTCMRCKEKSNTFDHFMDFILDIKQNVTSLERALDKFIQPELLEDDNSYKCPKCKMEVTAQKRFTVYRAPNVATFQLKRFDYNRSFGGKITKPITYPEKLNLRPYMSDPKGEAVIYKLNAVLVHSGQSCNSGHYFCYVKNSNGCWYIMDDDRVGQVRLHEVLNQSAYVLFYIKSETVQLPSFKKCGEIRNHFSKDNLSATHFKKLPETSSLKSAPLIERNHMKQSNPIIPIKPCPTLVTNKRPPLSPNLNRERVPFGPRASMPNIQDLHRSFDAPSSPAKKLKPSLPGSKPANNLNALVPYVKDSSESDGEVEVLGNSKVETPTNSPQIKKLDDAKSGLKIVKNSNNPPAKLEVNAKLSHKLSKSVFGFNRSYSASPSPKVVATGSWTVTKAPVKSLTSSLSSDNVNSINGWDVTNSDIEDMDQEKANKSTVNKSVVDNTETTARHTVQNFSETVKSPGDAISQNFKGFENASATSSPDNRSNSSSKSNGKNCDFRRKEHEGDKTFLGKTKNSPTSSPFFKRKCGDSDQKTSQLASDIRLHENGHNGLSKKPKYPKEMNVNPPITNGFSPTNKESFGDVKHDSKIHFQADCSNSSPNKTHCFASNNKQFTESSKNWQKEKGGLSSRCSSPDSDYEWVEKTKDSIEGSRASSQKVDKFNRKTENQWDTHQNGNHQNSVVSELKKNSHYFYGASVPTWNGESHYKESDNSINQKRKYFEDYEDEYDRGKVRKFKPKKHFYKDYKDNPFQRYADNNYNKSSNYNGNFNHGYQKNRHRPYDSNYRWKQNRHDYGQQKRHFKPHFRR